MLTKIYERYMKMNPTFFGRKGKGCSHQRRIQNPVKYLSYKKVFTKIVNASKLLTIFVPQRSEYVSGYYTNYQNIIRNVIRNRKLVWEHGPYYSA